MSWIESTLYNVGFPLGSIEDLLQAKSPLGKAYFKGKSNFATKPIPTLGLKGMFKRLIKEDASFLIWTPYGGKMSKIPESEIPFPHRNGTIFKILYYTSWPENENTSNRHIKWIRELNDYMMPYVSSSPRQAYVNYRDLDLGNYNFKRELHKCSNLGR